MSNKMNLTIKPRQSGRTTELINRCASYRYALIVCPTRRQAEYVFKMAIDSKMDIPMPITFKEFVDGRFYAPNINAFLFDNLDGCLEAYSHGVKIDSVVFEEERVDIENLPSAQPDVPDTNVVDTIIRQTAIDAVQGIGRLATLPDNDAVVRMSAVEYVLFNLPSAQPERKQMKIEYTEWNEEIWGQSAICGNCGCTWQIANNGEDNFCPNCGAQMIQEGENNDK